MSLAEFAGPDRLDIAARAALISSTLQSTPVSRTLLLGAGLGIFQNDLRPIVVVAQERIELRPGMHALAEIRDAWGTVAHLLGGEPDWLLWTGAFVIPSPEQHVAAGGLISSPNIGTVGCQASWRGGTGFLTAGHVAPTTGADVFDGRTRLGTVKFANNPAGGGSTIQADIAVVELSSGASFAPTLGSPAVAAPNAAITIRSGKGAAAAIMGFCSFVHLPSVSGTYGDTYFTDTAVSTGGDSGSAVVDTTTGNVIGLVVAGTPGVTTFIQDVRYQIAQAASLGSISGLTV